MLKHHYKHSTGSISISFYDVLRKKISIQSQIAAFHIVNSVVWKLHRFRSTLTSYWQPKAQRKAYKLLHYTKCRKWRGLSTNKTNEMQWFSTCEHRIRNPKRTWPCKRSGGKIRGKDVYGAHAFKWCANIATNKYTQIHLNILWLRFHCNPSSWNTKI